MVIPLLTTSFWNVPPFLITWNVIHHLLMVDFTIFLIHEMFFPFSTQICSLFTELSKACYLYFSYKIGLLCINLLLYYKQTKSKTMVFTCVCMIISIYIYANYWIYRTHYLQMVSIQYLTARINMMMMITMIYIVYICTFIITIT